MLKKSFIALYTFFFLALTFAQEHNMQTVNTAAANNCLQKAVKAVADEKWAEARFYSQLGLAYNGNIADFLYIIAMSGEKLDYPVAEQVSYVEQANELTKEWHFFDREQSLLLCARLYANTKRYSNALQILSELPSQTADIDAIKLRCYYGLADKTRARSFLQEALDKWAFDFRFVKLFLQNEKDSVKNATTRQISQKIIARSYVWETSNPEVLVLLSPYEEDPNETVRRLKIYREMYAPFTKTYTCEDLFVRAYALLLSLNYGIISEEIAVNEFFNMTAIFISPETQKKVRSKGFFSQHLEELCRLVTSPYLRAVIAQKIVSYNDCIFDNEDDSILNTVIFYENGRPTSAWIDSNQDMKVDTAVYCNFGIPNKIEAPGSNMTIQYDEYPRVKSIAINDSLYVMRPHDLVFKPISLQPLNLNLFDLSAAYSNLYIITENYAQAPLTQRVLLSSAVYLDEVISKDPLTVERVLLNKGVAISSQTFLGDVVTAYAQYNNGVILTRHLDRDCDGYFETEQTFDRQGNLVAVSIDINGNKRYEYTEVYQSSENVEKKWDSNEDGTWEILVKKVGEFLQVQWIHPISKEVVEVDYKGTSPYSVRYLGSTEYLYAEEGGSFYWVGVKPSSVTLMRTIQKEIERYFNQNLTEVVSYSVNIQGLNIFAVKSGGIIFAQVIE